MSGYHDGNHRKADQYRHQHERAVIAGVGQDQQELRGPEPYVQREHVDGEQRTAVLTLRTIVEPTLGNDIDAGEAHARDHAHGAPGQRVDQDRLDENRRRGDRRHGSEDPYVSDPAYQARRSACPDKVSHVVARHDGADDRRRESFEGCAHCQQGALEARPQHEDAHTEKEGPRCGDDTAGHCEYDWRLRRSGLSP